MTTKQQDDPDAHKGDGLDKDGLPDDPIATAEDRIGANEDESQG